MADTVGEATFLVKIRDMVTGPMKGIAAKLGETMRDISKIAAGNLLSTGIMRAVDAMKNFVEQGIAMNMQIDNLSVTFTSMLGSQRKATQLMRDLTKFAADTPFELQGLSEAAVALLGTNKIAQNQVIPTLRKLGDAAAGSSKGFAAMPRVVTAIVQMIGKGKLQTEEMNQLAEAGIPAWVALSNQMGISEAKLRDMAQKGKLGVKEIMMLVDGLGAKYAGLADKQSKTFSGMISTLQDNVALSLAKMTRPIYDKMTAVMNYVAKIMGSEAFTKGLDRVTAVITYIMDLLSKAFDSPLAKAVAQIALVAAGLIAAGAAMAWVPTLAGLAAALAPTVAIITAIIASATALAVIIKNAFSDRDAIQFRRQLLEIWGMLQEIGTNLRDAILPIIKRVGVAISSAFGQSGSLQAGFNSFLGVALGGLSTILDYVSLFTSDFNKTWEFMKLSAAAALSHVGDLMEHLLTVQAPIYALAFSEAMFEAIDQTIMAIYTMIPAIVDMNDEMMAAAVLFASAMPDAMAGLIMEFGRIGQAIVKNFQTLFYSLSVYIGKVFSAAFEDMHARLGYAIKAAKALLNADSREAFKFAKLAAGGDGKADIKAGQAAKEFGEKNAGLAGDLEERFKKVGEIFRDKVLNSSAEFGNAVKDAASKAAGITKQQLEDGSKRVSDVFNNITKRVPGFEKSPLTKMLDGMAGKAWDAMRQDRNKKRGDRFIEGLGLDKIPEKIGGFLGDMLAKGGMGFFGGVEDALGIFAKKPGAAEEKRKKMPAEFVGLGDMNKRIQQQLGKEDKDKKAHLAAAKKGAAAAEKGAAAGAMVVQGVHAVKDAIGKLVLGFGK